MPTKKELLKTLKELKTQPRPLTSRECDDLIQLLGGSTRDRKRPEVLAFGLNRRQLNWGGLASLVFRPLAIAERVESMKAELERLTQPGYLTTLAPLSPNLTIEQRARAERSRAEWLADEISYLTRAIEQLTPMGVTSRAESVRRVAEQLQVSVKHIENELTALREKAGLKRLTLAEYRVLEAESYKN